MKSAKSQRRRTFSDLGLKIQEVLDTGEILSLIGEELEGIGLNCAVFFLDDKQKNLKVEYTSVASSLVTSLERLVGIKRKGLKIPVESGGIHTVTLREKRAFFIAKPAEILKEVIPSSLTPLASQQVVKMLGLGMGIAAPLIAKGEAFGVLDVWSTDLSRRDVPMVVAFANQVGTAIGDARLFSEVKVKVEELKKSKEKHSQLVEDISDGYVVTQGGIIVFANQRCDEILGHKPGEGLGKPFIEFLAPDCHQEAIERHEGMMRGEEEVPERYEVPVLRGDGTTVPVEVSIKSIHYEGSPALCAIVRDISGRKRTEEELRKAKEELKQQVRERTAELRKAHDLLALSEERYRAIVEYAVDAIVVYDSNDVVQLWNKQAEKIFGYNAEEVVGKNWYILVPGELRGEIVWLADEVKQKGFVKNYVTERIRKDGKKITIELTKATLMDSRGKLIGVSAMIRDITERRLIEQQKAMIQEKLTRSEELYKSVFNYAGLAMGVQDTKGIVQLWNEEAERITGYKADEVVGRELPVLLADSPEQRKKVLKQVLEEGCVENYESDVIRKDGIRVPLELTLAAIRDNEGNITGISFTGRDVSDRKRLEQEREEAQQQLMASERLAAIGELASIMGHELRNPLGVISNAIYYLKMKLDNSNDNGKVQRYLDIMGREVSASSQIISNLLDYARPKQPAFQDVDVNSIIELALENSTLPPDVKVVTKLEETSSQIVADADQLQQVFLNLVSNAAQAMPLGGGLFVRATQNGDFTKVEFEDTGVGIESENMEKVFEPMFSSRSKGAGLGLAIARSIVESHCGKIEVSSEVGKGTTFVITLPIGGKT